MFCFILFLFSSQSRFLLTLSQLSLFLQCRYQSCYMRILPLLKHHSQFTHLTITALPHPQQLSSLSPLSLVNLRAASIDKVENLLSLLHSHLGTYTLRTFRENMLKILRVFLGLAQNQIGSLSPPKTTNLHLPLDASSVVAQDDNFTLKKRSQKGKCQPQYPRKVTVNVNTKLCQ